MNTKYRIDWKKEIKLINEKTSREHFKKLSGLVFDWGTCATSGLNSLIEKSFEGEPADKELRILGYTFIAKIANLSNKKKLKENKKAALDVLEEIKELEKQLLTKI